MIDTLFHLLIISVIVSLFAFALIRGFFLSFLVACTATAIVSSVLFQVYNYLLIGYLDPFFLIAMAVTTPIAFGYAAVVGLIIWQAERKGEPQ